MQLVRGKPPQTHQRICVQSCQKRKEDKKIQKYLMNKSACSVAATYKPPMLVPRVQLPAGALQCADAGE